MSDPYETLSVRGNRWPENRRMYVYLYPNTPAEGAACDPGSTIPTAIEGAVAQLFDADALSYFRLARFPAGDDEHDYPRVGADELRGGFQDYLRGTDDEFSDRSWCADGDCPTLRRYRGVHLLVHGYGFGTDLAGAEADDCRYNGGTGFSRGAAAWTSADDGSGEGITRNSAIQETLHLFVRSAADAVQDLLCDANGDGETSAYEEHTLGAIDPTGAVTPMLTYHVDEHRGCRHPPRDWDGSYTPALTESTKTAVLHTGLNQCRPQPGLSTRPDGDG